MMQMPTKREMWLKWIPVTVVLVLIALFIPATEGKAATVPAATTVSVVTMADLSTGGSGDFYKHVYCTPSGRPRAVLDIENYDIATGQRYKVDLDAVSGYTPRGIWIDGRRLSGWNNVYWDDANRGATHRISAQWYLDPVWLAATVSCARTL